MDGGGTRTTAVVVDEQGEERARLEGGPGLVGADPAATADALTELVGRALARAGATRARAVCCALAGVGDPDLRAAVRRRLERAAPTGVVVVATDAQAALFDAFGEGPGLLLIAGTGSIAVGRAADGRLARVGGWGALLGDEGSAWAIGLAAARAVLRAHDGRDPRTGLTRVLLDAAGLDGPERLVAWAAAAAKADVASLAPAVIEAAGADAVAAAIVTGAVDALAAHARTIADRLGPWPDRRAPLALAGGLIAPGRPLHHPLAARLKDDFLVLDRPVDAARGAARMARRAAEAP